MQAREGENPRKHDRPDVAPRLLWPATTMSKTTRRPLTSWLVRLLVPMLVAVAAARFVADQLFSTRDVSRTATCDNIYVALNGEVANELDGALNGGTGQCHVTDATGVVECALRKHVDEDNPLNKRQRAYVWGSPQPCQVALTPSDRNGVVFSQVPAPGSATRTFSIVVK